MTAKGQPIQDGIESAANILRLCTGTKAPSLPPSTSSFAEHLNRAVQSGRDQGPKLRSAENARRMKASEKPTEVRSSPTEASPSKTHHSRPAPLLAQPSAPQPRPVPGTEPLRSQDQEKRSSGPAEGSPTSSDSRKNAPSTTLGPGAATSLTGPIVALGLNDAGNADRNSVDGVVQNGGGSAAPNLMELVTENLATLRDDTQSSPVQAASTQPDSKPVETFSLDHALSGPASELNTDKGVKNPEEAKQPAGIQSGLYAVGNDGKHGDKPTDASNASSAGTGPTSQRTYDVPAAQLERLPRSDGQTQIKSSADVLDHRANRPGTGHPAIGSLGAAQNQSLDASMTVAASSGSASGDNVSSDGGARREAHDSVQGGPVEAGEASARGSSESASQFAAFLASQPPSRAAASTDGAAQASGTSLAAENRGLLAREENPDSSVGRIVNSADLIRQAGRTEMRVDLRTDALGAVQLHATLERGRLDASIGVESSEAHGLLNSQLPALHQALADRNVPVEHVKVIDSSTGSQIMGQGAGSQSESDGFSRPQPNTPRWVSNRSQAETGASAESEMWAAEDQSRRLSVRA